MLFVVPVGTAVTIDKKRSWTSSVLSKELIFEKKHFQANIDDMIHFKKNHTDYYIMNSEVRKIS